MVSAIIICDNDFKLFITFAKIIIKPAKMKKHLHFVLGMGILLFLFYSCEKPVSPVEQPKFITINGPDLVAPDGSKFFIQGINLGNWLNPEGYMFKFSKTSSARLIDQAFKEMVGPDFTQRILAALQGQLYYP